MVNNKKVKAYNLSKSVIDEVHLRAVEDGRKDSDWLNRYLEVSLERNNKVVEKLAPKKKALKFCAPLIFEVAEYCHQRNNQVDPQSFIDHYESNGWMRGKTKIKDWKACVRTWEKKASEKANSSKRNIETPTDRARAAADKLRRQQSTYTENDLPVRTNDRLIR